MTWQFTFVLWILMWTRQTWPYLGQYNTLVPPWNYFFAFRLSFFYSRVLSYIRKLLCSSDISFYLHKSCWVVEKYDILIVPFKAISRFSSKYSLFFRNEAAEGSNIFPCLGSSFFVVLQLGGFSGTWACFRFLFGMIPKNVKLRVFDYGRSFK